MDISGNIVVIGLPGKGKSTLLNTIASGDANSGDFPAGRSPTAFTKGIASKDVLVHDLPGLMDEEIKVTQWCDMLTQSCRCGLRSCACADAATPQWCYTMSAHEGLGVKNGFLHFANIPEEDLDEEEKEVPRAHRAKTEPAHKFSETERRKAFVEMEPKSADTGSTWLPSGHEDTPDVEEDTYDEPVNTDSCGPNYWCGAGAGMWQQTLSPEMGVQQPYMNPPLPGYVPGWVYPNYCGYPAMPWPYGGDMMQICVPPQGKYGKGGKKAADVRAGGEKKGRSSVAKNNGGNASGDDQPVEDGTQTTLMVRHIPNRYTQEDLLELLDEHEQTYDFVYLPMDFRNGVNLGYAFVNFLNHEEANRFRDKMENFSAWKFDSDKKCALTWAHPHQGKKQHVERYRNSPVMHESMPAKFKPMIFEDGVRVEFPGPTKNIRAPKLRPVGHERTSGVQALVTAGGAASAPNHPGEP